jgi:dipeptidyl aminopeptidase/acylaminoacyl peptidase
VHRITRTPEAESYPRFSPDGRLIAFTRQGDVYVLRTAGGPERRLTWHPQFDTAVGWTPDGRQIIIESDTIFTELPYFKEFASIPELDYLTYDNYGANARSLAIAHQANKPVYMEETGRPHYVSLKDLPRDWQSKSLETYSKRGVGAIEFEPLDSKLKVMKLYLRLPPELRQTVKTLFTVR